MESSVGTGRVFSGGKEETSSCSKSYKVIVSAITVVAIVSLCGLIQVIFFEGNDCGSQLKDGHWNRLGKWQTHRCIMHHFKAREMAECLQGWDKIVIMGDDQAKEHYKAFTEIPSTSTQCKFLLHPTLSKSVLDAYEHIAKEMKGESSLLVMHQPNALEMTEVPRVLKEELQSVRKAQETVLQRAGKCKVIIVLSADATYSTKNEKELIKVAKQVFSNMSSSGIVLIELAAPSGADIVSPISEDLNIILNSFCNSPHNSSCCVSIQDNWSSYLAHSVVLAVLAVYFGFYLVFASGATFALSPYLEERGVNMDRFFSILHAVGTATGVVLYMQMCTSLRYLSDTNMSQDFLMLWIGLVILGTAALTTITKAETVEVLSRSQCEEWRGWMVLLLVMVHWTGFQMESLGEIVERLAVGSVVFLSGYCNFVNLFNRGEKTTSWEALWGLVKLNSVPVVVAMAVGSSYLVYYLAPLLSLCYLFTLLFVQAWPSIPTKASYGIAKSAKLSFVVKLISSVLLFLCLPYMKDIVVGALSGLQWSPEFIENVTKVYRCVENNRITLLWGVVFGYVMMSLKENLASWSRTQKSRFRITMIGSGSLLFVVYVTTTKKALFEDQQSMLGIVPILSYVLLRNGFETAQRYSSMFLQEAGSLTMWLFVSHYHIVVTYGGKGIVVLLPGSYYINNLLVLTVYLLIGTVLYRHLQLFRRTSNISSHLLLN